MSQLPTTTNSRTLTPPKPVVYARRIAEALERHLLDADTSVHWVHASGDESSYRRPTAIWPEGDLPIRICVFEGSNEGSRIEVMYEANQAPFQYLPLLRVKTLSGMKRAFEEASHVYEFLRLLDPETFREKTADAASAETVKAI